MLQRAIAKTNLRASKTSNKIAITIAAVSAALSAGLSAIISAAVPMSIKNKQVDSIIVRLKEPIEVLDSLANKAINEEKTIMVDSAQVEIVNNISTISKQLNGIIKELKDNK